MHPDLTQDPENTHANQAEALIAEVEQAKREGGRTDTDLRTSQISATLAQAHATLALAYETRAAAYDTRTEAYVAYLATLGAGSHADKQHAAVVDKLVRDRLGFKSS